ncbi:hypothetical protein HK101_011712 [Irineochytrium annulatum]|nr:hypothetical protein HK101_011712 [Irineochytrium annulatum]
MSLKAQVSFALKKAREAVRFDGEESYAEALDAYRDTIVAMENVLSMTDEVWLNDEETGGNTTTLPAGDEFPTEEERAKIIELRNTYVQRVDLLLANLPAQVVAVYNGVGFGVRPPNPDLIPISDPSNPNFSTDPSLLQSSYDEFLDEVLLDDPSALDAPEPPPRNPDHRAFWLMRLLARTMKQGGMLTPTLHVPRHVWYQTGTKLMAAEAKFQACESLYMTLKRFRDLGDVKALPLEKVAQSLEELEGVADGIRATLGKKLKAVGQGSGEDLSGGGSGAGSGTSTPRQTDQDSVMTNATTGSRLLNWGSKLSRGLSTLGKGKAEKVADMGFYIELLSRLFQQSQFLEIWMKHFEGQAQGSGQGGAYQGAQILERLRRISGFYMTVICGFVLKDFQVLMERYLNKMGQVASLPA